MAVLALAQRVDAADDAVELDHLAVPIAGEQFLERGSRRLGHAALAKTGHARGIDHRREIARRRAALDGHVVADAHLERQPAHLYENAFLGVLHEQQRPGGVDVGDDAFDADGAPERGGIADTNFGDAGQN